jgi:predicted dehydrogenase
MRIGVMGGSQFARQTMVPALLRSGAGKLMAVASRSAATAAEWAAECDCAGVEGYTALLARDDIDVIYIPLPTGLHAEWCTKALLAGKHLLVEKSFAGSHAEVRQLVELARSRGRLVMENFHFPVHSQWARLSSFMTSGEIGQVHLVRSTFGFPPFPPDNIRWQLELGGGALLDAGAYVAKLSQLLLGQELIVTGASLQVDLPTGVDRYGAAMFQNRRGQVAQVAFGFDYFYQCRLELLGTKGKMSTDRVFTAKPGFQPVVHIETESGIRQETLSMDDAYANMWDHFAGVLASGSFHKAREAVLDQARVLDRIREVAVEKRAL